MRRWEKEQKFFPEYKTPGGHRRYCLNKIKKLIYKKSISEQLEHKKTYIYARVSSHDQKLDLKRQIARLEQYCQENNEDYEVISDLGSGINYQKRGLNKLIGLICNSKIKKIILTHKDRLVRFGFPLLKKLCDFFNTEILILNEDNKNTVEQNLVADVIEIMTVFTAKLHGMRSNKNKKSISIN